MPTWALDVVAPTCGLTRASTALARVDLGLAWAFNPAAFLLAGVARWVVGRTRHVCISVTFHLTRLGWFVALGLFIQLGINQQLHEDLVMNGSV